MKCFWWIRVGDGGEEYALFVIPCDKVCANLSAEMNRGF